MIKVLERKELPGKQPVIQHCSRCKSTLEMIPEKDCKYRSDQRGGDYWQYTCPVCNTPNSFTLKAW